MKKVLLVIALGISLAGCSTLSAISTGVSIATKSIANPVTTNDLFIAESSFRVVVAALQAYKDACAQNAVDKSCRANVAAVQKYTIQIPPYLTQVRTFLRNNDQINAVNTYNVLVSLITQAKSTAIASGVSVGG